MNTEELRKKEIIETGIEYTMQNSPCCISGDNFYEMAREFNRNKSFEAGATWSDEHLKYSWISVEDDLPCNHKELLENENYTKKVLVVLSWNESPTERHINILDMSNIIGSHKVDFYWRCNGYYTITHWSPLPELPKEQKV